MKKYSKMNPRVLGLVNDLYAKSEGSKTGIWHNLATRLGKSARSWASINVGRLNRVTKKGETIVVPGKVLGAGNLDHPLTLYSFNCSERACDIIKKAGGTCKPVEELLEVKTVKGIRILS